MKQIALFFSIAVCLALGLLSLADTPLLVDEKPHYAQIRSFMEGTYDLNPDLTTLPGYHYTIFFVATLFSLNEVFSLRIITTLISVLAIIVFFLIARELSKEDHILIQFVFLPLLFPFFFLIYTDILSLLLVLLSFYLLLTKRYHLSGTMGTISMLVRQNNIIWLLLFFLLAAYSISKGKIGKEEIIRSLKRLWTFLFGGTLFVLFVVINRGVSLGDRDMHPSSSFHMGNVFFLLFLFFFLFLPLHIANGNKIVSLIKKHYRLLIALFAILFFLYLVTFVNGHPYNVNWGDYFLRNRILIFFHSSLALKVIFFIPVFLSLLSLGATALEKKEYYLLYPATFFFLLPSWLIEQRYYIVPLTLFLLFKKQEHRIADYATIFFYFAFLVLFMHLMSAGQLFW